MADDKVTRLAEKLVAGYSSDIGPFTACFELERILRAELRPLLDIAEAVTGIYAADSRIEQLLTDLAAELKGWRKE